MLKAAFSDLSECCLLNRMLTERNVVNTYNIEILIVAYTLYSQFLFYSFSDNQDIMAIQIWLFLFLKNPYKFGNVC